MRYWLSSAAILLCAFAVDSQDTKKKEEGGKDKAPATPTEFMGKGYDAWRKELKSLDPSKRETAMKAVLMFDMDKATEAIPDIIADISRHPKKVTIDLAVRVNGVMALNTYFGHLAQNKKKPDPKLIKEVLPIYRVGLKDSQAIMKVRALQGLQYLGPAAHDLLDDVIVLARDPSTWEVRKEAIPMLVMLAYHEKTPPEPKAMIALKNSADKEKELSYMVRVVAVSGLGILGKDASIVDLRRALEGDPSKEVRMAAAQAFVHAREKAMPDLKKAINEQPNKEVRIVAVQAYGVAGKEKALPELRKHLDDKEKEVRLMVINTISALTDAMDPAAKEITKKALAARLSVEKEPIVLIWLNMGIMNINHKCDKTHMEPILNRLTDKDALVRVQAFQALRACGKEAPPFAMEPLLQLAEGTDHELVIAALETLVLTQAYESIPRLEKLMKNGKDQDIRQSAETAIDNLNLIKAQEKKLKEKTPDKKK